ncbi:MAG: Nif3-like dinuclear metal center hexameric protein [Candidatus Micrarchaeaceae archaeon]
MKKITTAKEIIVKLQELFPDSLESEWDTTEGLISGNAGKEVRNVVLSLEFRDNIINKDADMIIVHHPPKFGPEKSVTNPFYKKMAAGDEVVYAIHSRMDRAGFAAKAIAEKLFGKVGYDVLKVLGWNNGQG